MVEIPASNLPQQTLMISLWSGCVTRLASKAIASIRIWLAIAGVVLSCSVPAARAAVAPAVEFQLAPDIQRIRDRGELIVAVFGKDTPPFFSNGAGGLTGIDIDLGKGIAESLGVRVRFDRSPATFNEAVTRVETRQADIAISKLSVSLQRASRLRFSTPYVTLRRGLLVNRLQLAKLTREGKSAIDVIKDFRGKLGTIQGTQYALVFSKKLFPHAMVVEYPDWDAVLDAVAKGEVLAAFRDEMEVKKAVLTRPDFALGIQTVAFTDTKDPIAAVLHWQDTQLLAFVNEYLALNDVALDIDRILARYPAAFTPRQPR